MPDTKANRFALAILAGFAIARLLFAFAIGLGIDESYTVAISRRLSLSYFDHPPLHLWIAHLAALALGENMAVRVVFVCLFFATGWIYYLFFRQPLEEASAWQFWPLVGLGLGLAGLSKYSAILTASGLVTFLVLAPEQRHWLKHPALYVSAIFACAMITPVVLWNAQHSWASFEFQGGRGVPNGVLRPAQSLTMVLGEVAFLSPWIFAPLVASIVSAFRHWRDERHLFLLCLSLPAIVLFSLTPLWGGRGQPHWTMPGWFFTFPLMGAWVEELGVSARTLRRAAFLSLGLLVATAGVAVVQVTNGWPLAILTAQSNLVDPTLEAFEWRDLAKAPIFDEPPRFVISTKWSDAGKIALALGPRIPVFVLSNDPRGWAFLDESGSFVGQNGVIVTPAAEAESTMAVAHPLFASLGQPELYELGRRSRPEIKFALIPAAGLTRRLPMPYAGAAGR